MDIRRRFRAGFTVLDLSGRFVVSAGESEILPFRSAIRALIEDGRVLVALNLAALTFMEAISHWSIPPQPCESCSS